MKFWWRELGGWLLIGLGLYGFALVWELCQERMIVQAWPVALIAIFIFRGGIQLLQAAIAARVCQQSRDNIYPATAPPLPPRKAPLRGGR